MYHVYPGNSGDLRQNYHPESEAAVNRQINLEFHACYVYLSISGHFDRADVGLSGFSKCFAKFSGFERQHALRLMDYQNLRGGRVVLTDIKKPPLDDWGTALDAMQSALQLERDVNQALLELHAVAVKHVDAQMIDFLETVYLEEQVQSMKEIADMVANLKRAGPDLGEYEFDQELLRKGKS